MTDVADTELDEEEKDSEEEDEDEDEDEDKESHKLILPSTVPPNLVELKHSFGYDCKRLFNLCLIDADTLIFASGNLLHYYSISRDEFTLKRTVYGCGVGFIMKNHIPEYNYLTIAENGNEPTVFIYRYPEFEIISALKGGAVRSFTCGIYSNNGELMATQAGHPDFMLTIWNWQTSSIILRSKAYQNDVLCVTFSQFNPILLATCGLSHAQFWKMAETFTGLKLKSDLGRFGKTDTCDIYAVYMLADEKVISGCEWGNMLVWEGGLIKLEVTRKARRPCHTQPITRIIWMGNNEVMTIGMDGYARIWFWETVELADPPEEDRFVEIDPIYEFRIGDKNESCESRHLIKAKPLDDNDFEYYSQDGKGGVWLCDLNTLAKPKPSKKLFSCHGGRVVAGQASPISSHIATLGEDGKVNIYNYETEELLLQEPFNAGGGDLIWLDTSVDPSGIVLIIGFENGVLREVALEFNKNKKPAVRAHLVFAIKPHATPIVCLAVTPSKDMLVTGSRDNTAFLFHIKRTEAQYVELIALGFLLFEGSPVCIHWDMNKPRTGLFGCHTGEIYECELPVPETIDLVKVRPTWRIYPTASRMIKFKSVKSKLIRDLEIAATMKRKAKKLRRKKREIKRLLEINPGLQIDESALADSSEEDEDALEKPLFIPDPPNPVLWLQYTKEDSIWVSMGGYDAGYVYEVKFTQNEPISCTAIPEANDVEMNSYMYIEHFLILGMQTGQIRINAVKPDFRDLTDFWLISMHDNLNGVISRVFTSRDGKWFFSVGHDGNVFYYNWWGPIVERICDPPTPFRLPSVIASDIEDPHHLSLEQVKIQENLKKLRAFEESERKRLFPNFTVMQIQVDWVTDKSKAEFQTALDAVLTKLKTDVPGACQDAQNLYDLMFKSLEYIPFEVFANNTRAVCRTFRLPKLKKIEEESIIEEMEEEGLFEEQSKSAEDGIESATTFAGSKMSHTQHVPIIYDFAEKVLLKFYIRILEFFTELKQIKREELERVMEVAGEDIEAYEEEILEEEAAGEEEQVGEEEERVEGEEEEEEEFVSIVERAISFLKNSIRDTVEVKTLEINIIQEILYTQKSQYNNKVIRLKDIKAKIHKKYERLEHDFIEAEMPIKLPDLRNISLYNEYPDEIFLEPFIALRSFESILWEKPKKKTAKQIAAELAAEEEHEVEGGDISVSTLEDVDDEGEGDELLLEEEPSEEWMIDMENLYEKVNERIINFDAELAEVAANRLQYEIELKYLHLLAEISDKELIILQDSELTEKELTERDEEAKMKRNELTVKINKLKAEIEATFKSFDVMNGEIKKIQHEFYEEIKGNKFFKFLKRIYEKKFKPMIEKTSDEESESESSSEESSDEEDEGAGSGESGEMTAIQLDESHCPPGCDRRLYDLAFELRYARHDLEQKIYDGHKLIDTKRIEIAELNSRIPDADDVCAREHTTLLIFRRQKDDKLHAVENAVIYSIEGFGLELEPEPEDDAEEKLNEYNKYLENLLQTKKAQDKMLREELVQPTETYTEKLRILLLILEERERLRQIKPVVIETPPPEKSISIETVIRPPTPPPPFDFEAYAAEKILKLVQRFFAKYLAKYMSEELMKRYIPKVARILGNIGRNFTCELADNIIEVLVENLQRIIPKKYLSHASLDDIRSLFKDIVAVFVMEPVEIDPFVVITEAVENGLKNFTKVKVANKTQKIILEICKVIVEELPMDDFRSSDTPKFMAKLLAHEAVIIPNCLNVDVLVEQISIYAKKHMLSAVTVKIVRAFASQFLKELIIHKADEVRSAKPRERVCRDVRRKKRV